MAWLPFITRTATGSHDGVYRTRNTTIAAWIATACTCLFAGLAAAPGKARLFDGIVAILFVVWTWRAWRAEVRVDDTGLRIGGYMFERRVAWSEIERFTVAPFGNNPYVGHIICTDGRPPIPLVGITGGPRTDKGRHAADPIIARLNQALGEWRSGQRSGIPDEE